MITFAVKEYCDVTVAVVDKDGKVIRHIASGLLGKNAPYPFQQDSLSQRIEWDGKDDEGKDVPAGCKVKVSLGLGARFDGIEKWLLMSNVKPLAIDGEGRLYASSLGGISSDAVVVFDKNGKYLRTLLPPPGLVKGGIDPGKYALIDWNKTVWGKYVPQRKRFGGGFEFDIFKYKSFHSSLRRGVVLPGGKLCLLYATRNRSVLFIVDVKDGSCTKKDILDLGKFVAVGMAPSPDGRWLYLTGNHAVMRMDAKRMDGKLEVFAGVPGKPGKDEKHLNKPAGIGCDGKGNVYVFDAGNKRIQVFKPDGGVLKTLPKVPGGFIGVSQKTGAIYLLRRTKKWPWNPIIVKLNGIDDPKEAARIEMKCGDMWLSRSISVMLSPLSDPPVLCFSGTPYKVSKKRPPVVSLIEDRGNSFKMTTNLIRLNKTPNASGDVTSPGMWSSLWVDRRTGRLSWVPVDRNGIRYLRGMFWERAPKGILPNKMCLVKYDPSTKRYISFEVGEPAFKGYRWNSFSGPFSWVKQDGKPVIGIPLYYARGSHLHQGASLCVAPNGDIYVGVTWSKQFAKELEKAGLPVLRTKRLVPVSAVILRVYEQSGRLKHPCVLPGLAEVEGIHVGRSGNVYIVQPWKSLGAKIPEGLAPGSRYKPSRWGALLKFKGDFKTFPVGRIVGAWEGGDPPNPTHWGGSPKVGSFKVRVEGVLWTYDGVSPHSALYSSCTCMKASFDLDEFERSFVCAAQTCTINVIDANGNVVARLGGYGNMDSRGADSPPGVRPLGFSLPRNVAVDDRHMWVVDLGNRMLLRARLVYEAEETVSVQ